MKLTYNGKTEDVAAVFNHDGHTFVVVIGDDWDNCGKRERRDLRIADLTFMEAEYGARLTP